MVNPVPGLSKCALRKIRTQILEGTYTRSILMPEESTLFTIGPPQALKRPSGWSAEGGLHQRYRGKSCTDQLPDVHGGSRTAEVRSVLRSLRQIGFRYGIGESIEVMERSLHSRLIPNPGQQMNAISDRPARQKCQKPNDDRPGHELDAAKLPSRKNISTDHDGSRSSMTSMPVLLQTPAMTGCTLLASRRSHNASTGKSSCAILRFAPSGSLNTRLFRIRK